MNTRWKVAAMAEELKLVADRLPAGFVTHPYSKPAGTCSVEDSRLVTRNPAPNATQPMVPSSPTVVVKISS